MVFVCFAVLWLGERVRWNYGVAFALILAAVYFAFLPGASPLELQLFWLHSCRGIGMWCKLPAP